MSEEAEFNNPNFTDGARSAFNFDKGECAKILLEAGVAFDEEDANILLRRSLRPAMETSMIDRAGRRLSHWLTSGEAK